MLRPPQVNKAVQSDVLKVVRRVLLFYDMSLLHKTSIILQTIKNTKRDNKNINVRYSSNSLCHRKLEVKKCNLLVRSQKIEEWRRRGLVLTTESSFTVQRSGVGGGVSFSSPSWQWTVLRRRRDVWSGGPSGWRSAGRAAVKTGSQLERRTGDPDVTRAIRPIHSGQHMMSNSLTADLYFKHISGLLAWSNHLRTLN